MTHVALVTGGAGFIGSHIVDALMRRRYKVVVVDDLSTGRRANVNPNVEFHKMSISSPAFSALLAKVKPEVVVHCAAQVNVRKSVQDPVADAQANVVGIVRLVASAKGAGVKKIIFSSSGGAMFSDKVRPPYTEAIPAQPVSPYGIAKRAGEMYLAFLQASEGIETVSLRYANVYGPRQNAHGEAGVVAIFTDRLVAGKPVTINGDGKQTRDFVYVEDVVRANMLALKPGITGVFHIGTGVETSVNTLYKTLCSVIGVAQTAPHAPAASGEVRRSALNANLAKRVLSWKPSVTLAEGLRRTVQYTKRQSRAKAAKK